MGNEPSLDGHDGGHERHQGTTPNYAVSEGETNGAFESDNNEINGRAMLPPMVLIVESVVWSSVKDPGDSQMFYIALLDGCEVGRAVKYPSPSVRIAPCTKASIVTLRFFAGLDAEGFLVRKVSAASHRKVGEVRIPLDQILQYGAPLYSSMWLGLPGDEAPSAVVMELNEALDYARRPICPKVRVTFFKPSVETLYRTPRNDSTPHQPDSARGLQPDIQAVVSAKDDDGGLDLCLGPSNPVQNQEIPRTQQVQGLVKALKHANDVAFIWQQAVFCNVDAVQARLKNNEDAILLKNEDGASVVSGSFASQRSNGRQELEKQLEATRQELADYQQKQQVLQLELEKARSDISVLGSQENQHIEELQTLLVNTKSENEALRAYHSAVSVEEHQELMRKLELYMQENVRLKQEQFEHLQQQSLRVADSPASPRTTQMIIEEHGNLKVQCALLQDERDAAKREREDLRRERDEALRREASLIEKCDGEQTDLRQRFEALYLQIDAHRSEKESVLQREQQRDIQAQELARDNENLKQRENQSVQMYHALEEQLNHVKHDRDSTIDRLAQQEARAAEEETILQEKLAQAQEKLESLAARFDSFQAEQFAPKPDVSGVVPVAEYEKVQMLFKEADQERESFRARLEAQTVRLRELEEWKAQAVTPPTTPPQAQRVTAHERSLAAGIPSSEMNALKDRLAATELLLQQAEQDRESYKEMAHQVRQTGISMEQHHALQAELDSLKESSSRNTGPSAEEYEALQSRLAQVEQEREAYIELSRNKDRIETEQIRRDLQDTQQQLEDVCIIRDNLNKQLVDCLKEADSFHMTASARQQEAQARAVNAAVAEVEHDSRKREKALQNELATLQRVLDDTKREKQALERPASSRSLREAPGSSRSFGSLSMSKLESEDVIQKEGEKTALGAKVSELRLAMKKKEAGYKEDITKLNRELMTSRALTNQEKMRRGDVEQKVLHLEEQAKQYEEQLRIDAARLEKDGNYEKDMACEMAKLQGENEVLRIRERQWQAIATGSSVDGDSSTQAASSSGAKCSKSDSFALRLFQRLVWEKFSHFGPDDIQKALKMDQRPATMPKSEVEKVIKMYRAHQKNFNMTKAFRSLDLHHTGRLAAHEFEMRLTQSLALDVEVAGHVYNLLHGVLHDDGNAGGGASAAASPNKSRGASLEVPTSSGSLKSGRQGSRIDSSKSIDAGMIGEEEFAKLFDSFKM